MDATKGARQLAQKHPLQRLPSPSRGFSAMVHVAGLASFAYSYLYLANNPNPLNDSYGWNFQLLTILGLTLTTLTFSFGLLADITLSPRLFLIKNALSVTSAPMEVLISILYWGLRAIDTKLVMPDWAPPLDLRADISFHAVPTIVLLIDLLFLSPPYALSVLPSLGISSTIACLYWFWVEHCYSHNGFYPYPIFDKVGFKGRIILFGVSAMIMSASYACLRWVYGAINGISPEEAVMGDTKDKKVPGEGY